MLALYQVIGSVVDMHQATRKALRIAAASVLDRSCRALDTAGDQEQEEQGQDR